MTREELMTEKDRLYDLMVEAERRHGPQSYQFKEIYQQYDNTWDRIMIGNRTPTGQLCVAAKIVGQSGH